MTVALSSLRVTAEMDSSAYTQGMAAKVAADQAGAASADAVGAALARTDAALDKAVPGVGRLSKSLLDGYGAASTFERTVRSIGDATDRGMGLDRANLLLDAAYRKFGLVADGATMAKQGYVSLVPAIDQLNSHYSIQAEILNRATQATLRNSEALTAQQQINARLGVTTPQSGAAQASAEAFMAPFGGLDGIAAARAQQIGRAFQNSLTQSMGIDAPTKAAKESASVFQEEFDRLDEIAAQQGAQIGQNFQKTLTQSFGIDAPAKSAKEAASAFQEEFDRLDVLARQRGEQMGQNFQKSLNESFGIGAAPATSQGATYSALDEMMKQQEAIAKAKAEQGASTTQQGIGDAFGIGAQAKSAKDSAAVFDEALKKEDALNASAQRLRDTIDPLSAAQSRLNAQLMEYKELAAAGKISTTELAAANNLAQKEFQASTANLNSFGGAAIFGSTQAMALSAAVRHMFDAVMAGRPITQAVSMEMGNLSYAMSGVGGMAESLKGIGSWILSLLSPTVIVTTAMAAFAVVAAAAVAGWQSAQLAIALALTGIGKAAGATVEDVNKIAEAHSSVSTISIAQARNVAMALAETGKVTKETFGPILDLTKDFAVTMGQSVAEAGKTLAGAFTDPVKGADDLNRRLGFLDDSTRKLIESLVVQGDRQGANKVLIDAISGSIGKATELTFGWSQMWNVVANSASNAFTKIGESLSKYLSGGGTVNDQIDALTKKLQAAQDRQQNTKTGTPGTLSARPYEQATAEVDQLSAALEILRQKQAAVSKDAEDSRMRDFSFQVGELVKAAVPAGAQIRTLGDDAIALAKAMSDPAFAMYLSEMNDLPQALARTKGALDTVIDAVEKQTSLQQLQLRAVDNRSPADRAAIASKQKELELAGQLVSAEERQTQIALAGKIASGGQTAADNIYIQRVALLGNMATITEKVTAKALELDNRGREGVTITLQQRDAILAQTKQQEEGFRLQEKITIGVATEAQIREVMSNETIAFISRRRTLALSQADDIAYVAYQEKRIEKMIEQSKIAGAQLEGLKKLELDSSDPRKVIDTTSVSVVNQMTTSLTDLTTGTKTASAAFQDFSKNILRLLEEVIIKMLLATAVSRSMNAAMGAFGGGGAGTPSPAPTGFGVEGHSGGMYGEFTPRAVNPAWFAGAPRFHSGMVAPLQSWEMPAIIRKDESVLTPGQMRAMGGAGGGGNHVQVNVVNNADGTSVKTTKRKQGNVDIHEVLISKVDEGIATGRFDGSMRARFGQQVQPRGR